MLGGSNGVMSVEALRCDVCSPLASSSVSVHDWKAQNIIKFGCKGLLEEHASPNPRVLRDTQHVYLGSMEIQQAGAMDTSDSLRTLVVLAQKSGWEG